MKINILFLILGTLFLSCGNDYKSNYVDKTSNVLDSIYNSNLPAIKSLINKTNLLESEKIVPSKTIFLDSTNILEFLSEKEILLNKTSYLNKDVNLTLANTIVVNDPSNWLSQHGINDSIINTLKSKYIITKLSDGTYENSPLYHSDRVPDYFHYYNNASFFNRYKDSVNLNKKNQLKLDRDHKLNAIKQIEYALVVNDIYVLEPLLEGKDTFSGGLMISSVDVYHINSKALVGKAVIYVESSEEVKHIFTVDIGNIKETIVNRKLKEDLLKQKTKKIVDYFNIR